MTKHSTDDMAIKCHVNLDQAEKVRTGVTVVFDKNALAIPTTSVGSKIEAVPKVKIVATRRELFKAKLENIMSEICDIENTVEREKPTKIDLQVDLYQMEEP